MLSQLTPSDISAQTVTSFGEDETDAGFCTCVLAGRNPTGMTSAPLPVAGLQGLSTFLLVKAVNQDRPELPVR